MSGPEPVSGSPVGGVPVEGSPVAGDTGIVVLVPAAEAAVGPHRPGLDPWAALGVPAHVTLLAPFLPPVLIDDGVAARIERAVAGFAAFDFRLATVRWFGDQVVWLAPDPADPFVALTAALVEEFPHHRPYGGAFDEVQPHLTVGAHRPVQELRAAAEVVAPWLPISCRAAAVTVIGRIGDEPYRSCTRSLCADLAQPTSG